MREGGGVAPAGFVAGGGLPGDVGFGDAVLDVFGDPQVGAAVAGEAWWFGHAGYGEVVFGTVFVRAEVHSRYVRHIRGPVREVRRNVVI